MLHIDPVAPTGDLDAWVKGAEDELEGGFNFILDHVPSLGFDAAWLCMSLLL